MPPPNRTRKKVEFLNNDPWLLNNSNNYPQRRRNNTYKNTKLQLNSTYRSVLNAVAPAVKLEVDLIAPRGASSSVKTVLKSYETWKYGYYMAIQRFPGDLKLQQAIQQKLLTKAIKDATYAILEDSTTTDDVYRQLVQPVYAHLPEDFRIKILEFADKELNRSRKYNRFSKPLPCNNTSVNWNAPFENWEPPPPPS